MKSLKTVIKQKCKFRCSTIPSEFFIFYKRSFWEEDHIPLYISHNGVRSKNIITLLKEMKSLIVFLFSCIQYDEGSSERGRGETRKLHFELKFWEMGRGAWAGSILDLTNSVFTESLHWYDMPTYYVESTIERIKNEGCYMSFDMSFTITLSLIRIDLDRFIVNRDNIPNSINNNKNEGIIAINEGKTFKNDLCVICLEGIPNVLFCSCGHVCICEECNKTNNFKKCPICKTENNILRIT